MIKDKAEIEDTEGKVDIAKRMFIKKAAAAVGVVAAAGLMKTFISASSDTISRNRAKYANDDLQQEKVMSQKQCVLMTDSEKKQMLEEILDNHKNVLA